MIYILNDQFALRSFERVPFAVYRRNEIFAMSVDRESFQTMLLCNGKNDFSESEIINKLLSKGLIREAREGETLSDWQKFKKCHNRYMPYVIIQLTGRCNYNCLHCFNAKDNERLQSELSYEQLIDILDQAKDCGINAITITGGEPLIHRQFREIIQAIYERDMFVDELNTNGYFLTQDLFDFFKSIGCRPLIKISFDGIGYHDWLRNRKGAEAEALKAIRLSIENGFQVMAQIQINRKNVESILPTMEMMDAMGVETLRVIKTTDVPRWIGNAEGESMDIAEYYDAAIAIMKGYLAKPHRAGVIFWQFLRYNPAFKKLESEAVSCQAGEYRESLPLCRGIRGQIAIGANGNLYPCFQLSGYFEAHGTNIGNIFKTPLKDILQSNSDYFQYVDTRVAERLKHNPKCAACPHWQRCVGGCPALGYADTDGDILGIDPWKCIFFEQGYEARLKELQRIIDQV